MMEWGHNKVNVKYEGQCRHGKYVLWTKMDRPRMKKNALKINPCRWKWTVRGWRKRFKNQPFVDEENLKNKREGGWTIHGRSYVLFLSKMWAKKKNAQWRLNKRMKKKKKNSAVGSKWDKTFSLPDNTLHPFVSFVNTLRYSFLH